MSEIELEPCPLCGPGKVFLNPPSERYRFGAINCPACLLVLPGEVRDQGELVSVWNTRFPSATKPEPIKAEPAVTAKAIDIDRKKLAEAIDGPNWNWDAARHTAVMVKVDRVVAYLATLSR